LISSFQPERANRISTAVAIRKARQAIRLRSGASAWAVSFTKAGMIFSGPMVRIRIGISPR
jgi:hypothetical protein